MCWHFVFLLVFSATAKSTLKQKATIQTCSIPLLHKMNTSIICPCSCVVFSMRGSILIPPCLSPLRIRTGIKPAITPHSWKSWNRRDRCVWIRRVFNGADETEFPEVRQQHRIWEPPPCTFLKWCRLECVCVCVSTAHTLLSPPIQASAGTSAKVIYRVNEMLDCTQSCINLQFGVEAAAARWILELTCWHCYSIYRL